MKIKKLEEKDYQAYEEFLLGFKESLLYYSVKFKTFLEDLLHVESTYLLAVDQDGTIRAVLPLMKKEGKYGTIINSLPYYGSNGGILAWTEEAYDFLLNHYYDLVNNVSGATYVTNPLYGNQKELQYDIVDKRIGQWTNLDCGEDVEENIMQMFDSSARRNVRKAIKSGVTAEVDNEQVNFLYEIHHKNITSINGKAKNNRFFSLIDKYFEKNKDYNIYLAQLDGKKIGALLLFYYNETVEYYTPAVVDEYRNVQALPLLIYKAMIDANKREFKWWNWGGTWITQDGVYKFKNKFGAVDKEYKYYIKINNEEIYNATRNELLAEYDNFYVIPFDKLNGE